MKRILVPIDFSDESKNALHVAAQIARKSDGGIILMHVLEDIKEQSYNVAGEMDLENHSFNNVYFIKLYEKVKRDIHNLANAAEYADVNIKISIQTGIIYQHIEDCIEKERIDLVVMGSKGASGFKELLLGSNAEKVVRYAKCPVLTVKGNVDINNFKSIVLASDFLTGQTKLIRQLIEFADVLGLELLLLKINTHYKWVNDNELLNELAEFAEEHNLSGAKLHVFDDPYLEDGVIRFAEQNDVDIIAMGTHGRTGLAHIIAGSVAEGLVNHTKRPVWTCNY